jgi:hypothetical protein
MDWLERLFGFSPDGGDGSAEAMIVFAACAVVAVIIYARVPKVRAYVRDRLRALTTRA